jgi:radical SAM protein with 4Fe4S-binding SPASM domain
MKEFKNYLKLYPSLLNINLIKHAFSYFKNGISSFPYSINFLITDRCNFRCKMCSFFAQEFNAKEKELDFEEVRKFLISIKQYKPIIALGGGEPFVKKDIFKIIELIKKECRLKCIIFTNGYLLNKEKINKLEGFKLDYIVISIYGDREIHDSITGINGSFEKIAENIKLIQKSKKLNFIISTVFMEENYRNLRKIVEDLMKMGVKKIKIENLNFITKKEYEFTNWQINPIRKPVKNIKPHHRPKEIFNLYPYTLIRENCFESNLVNEMLSILKEIKFKNRVFLKPNLSEKEFISWYGSEISNKEENKKCYFIKHSLFIDPYGNIIPCQFLRNCILGNIKKDKIEKLWNSEKYFNLRKIIDEINLPLCFRCCK